MEKNHGTIMEKSKKFSLKIVLATVAVFLFGLIGGFTFSPANAWVIHFDEVPITTNGASQENPDIDGLTIVYQDNRNGNWDIYAYNVYGYYPETRITTDTASQISPRVSGNRIVYMDDRNGNWDIYMYDLSTKTETQVTNNPFNQEYPDIDGNRIVWQDNRNGEWDIYVYDLSTHTETRVTSPGQSTSPAISGNRIAYTKDYDIYCFDLSSGEEVKLTSRDEHWWETGVPAISVNRVVWGQHNRYDYYLGEWDVYLKDVVTGETWDTHYTEVDRKNPNISELQTGVYYTVYSVKYTYFYGTSTYWNLHLYRTDPETSTEYRLTSGYSNQINPRVSGGRIVYMDTRNGNWDIYMTMVSYTADSPPPGSEPPATADAAIDLLENIQGIIADPVQIPTSNLSGANSNVKENRRDALLDKLEAVIASIQAGADSKGRKSGKDNYLGAINQLDSILDKTDGCALRGTPDTNGSGFTPDWIISCESQEIIDPLIKSSITTLEALIKQGVMHLPRSPSRANERGSGKRRMSQERRSK